MGDSIIDFAQRRFGANGGVPPDIIVRPRLPDWVSDVLAGRVGSVDTTAGTGERVVRIEPDDVIAEEQPGHAPIDSGRGGDASAPDLLAFYLPFHYYTTDWGIYIRARGVLSLARRFDERGTGIHSEQLAAAYAILLEHERCHFAAEYAASRIEVVTAYGCYDPYFSYAAAAPHEEALANSYALTALRRNAGLRHLAAVAESWMGAQGPGYCDFADWLPPNKTAGERLATVHMSTAQADAWHKTHAQASTTAPVKPGGVPSPMPAGVVNRLHGGQHPADFLFRRPAIRQAPVVLVIEPGVPWVRVGKPFPKEYGLQIYVYSNDHKPPHIHIDCPPGSFRTRYTWPDLRPLPGDSALRSSEEKHLRQYMSVHRQAIARRVAAIPWQ